MEEASKNEAETETTHSALRIPNSAMEGSAIRNPQSLVLIVEDSPIQAKLLERILLGAGYRVAVARDGAEGLEMAHKEKPALIISDINMPVMNGFELCKAIKSDEALRLVPVILLTMLTDTRDVIRALSVGADSYINKPYDAERLLYRIRFVQEHPVPPPPTVERRKMVVELDGETYQVTASSSQQILNLLLYTYDNAVVQNADLITTQDALKVLNEHLEDAVNKKTAELVKTLDEQKVLVQQQQQQLDELRRFNKVSIGREARMKELFDENKMLLERMKKAGVK